MTTRRRLALLTALLLMAAIACGGDDGSGSDDVEVPPTIVKEAQPQPTPKSQPSGVADVDVLIAIVTARDQAAWTRAVKLTPLPCTTSATDTEKPLCQGSEAADTPAPVVQRNLDNACQQRGTQKYIRAVEVPGILQTIGSQQLYTVYILHSPGGTPRYGVVYATKADAGVMATRLQVEAGQVVGIDFYCKPSFDDLIIDVSPQDIVLPPQFR